MDSHSLNSLLAILEQGVGTRIEAKTLSQNRNGVRVWFTEYDPLEGPVFELESSGISRHRVSLKLGKFSGNFLKLVAEASDDTETNARAILRSIQRVENCEIVFSGENTLSDWSLNHASFQISATRTDINDFRSLQSFSKTATLLVIPIMSAVTELVSESEKEEEIPEDENLYEGALLHSVVRKRERNRKLKRLALEIHGKQCAVCGLKPEDLYSDAGDIIEVHHLQPLGTLDSPKAYNPETDLIPLCPNCHRAAHERKPLPFTPEELRSLIGLNTGSDA